MCNLSKGVEAKGIARGRIEGRAEGRAEGKIEGKVEGILSSIKNLMSNMGWSVEQAMAALGVPESDYSKYMGLLNQ